VLISAIDTFSDVKKYSGTVINGRTSVHGARYVKGEVLLLARVGRERQTDIKTDSARFPARIEKKKSLSLSVAVYASVLDYLFFS
jgi:hypothetical protein